MLLQQIKADELMDFLNTLPQVKSCSLYGSLTNGKADRFSDIDISVDVSGVNNGMFMKTLPSLLS